MWDKLLNDYFGRRLTAEQVQRWEDELASKIPRLTAQEIADAIREASERDYSQARPSLQSLRGWVLKRRARWKAAPATADSVGFLRQQIRARIGDQGASLKIWALIVEPMSEFPEEIRAPLSTSDQRALAQYAESLGWSPPTYEEMYAEEVKPTRAEYELLGPFKRAHMARLFPELADA